MDLSPNQRDAIAAGWEPLSHALAVRTKFVVANSDVSGIVLIIFGIDSLDRLLQHADRWVEASQG